ncbi:hypothetical protein CPB86DRAFT_707200 [Serendipita vermifera]|nr:hypothetical protein CPB86DRAFT_707200 [Serendipita vermifera]
MVLGISLRGKKKKEEPTLKPSPSLPSVLPQGIPWPEDLVNIQDVRDARTKEGESGGKVSRSFTTSASFSNTLRGKVSSDGSTLGTIASLFTSKSAQNGGFIRSGARPNVSLTRSQRRRVAPTLNIMVAGARGTGKTSLLKLFIDTSEISSTATPEQKLSVETFMSKSRKSTRSLQTASIEIAETRFDRVLLTLIDTPGLSFEEGQELSLERSVSSLVKYLDNQFDETMGEEQKVVRQSKGDQHVHLCIYLIDPASIMTTNARRAKYHMPSRNRSQVTVSPSNKEESDDDDDDLSDGYEDDHHHSSLSMNPAELRVIKRLAARVNVLPVIARTDSLTESRLKSIKRTVNRELKAAGIGFGVFSSSSKSSRAAEESQEKGSQEGEEDDGQDGASVKEEPERKARPIIRIRPRKSFSGTERSRSRRRRSAMGESPERSDDDTEQPPLPDGSSVTRLTRSGLESILPFALVSPQPTRKGRHPSSPTPDQTNVLSPSELDPNSPSSRRSSAPPSAFPQQYQSVSVAGEFEMRDFPRGQYVRKYKWGTLDVLDPAHCDFVALRTAVLATHFKVLKLNTREVLYEKYRTDKLLARRATRNITTEDRNKILHDLGL